MAPTRARALDAAVEVVGTMGIRALTHARVDERAGLPKGSTSNFFRTRDALVAGVVEWIAESERADFAAGSLEVPATSDELVDALTSMIEVQSGPWATRTRARYALFLDAASHPAVLAPLRSQRHEFEEWMRGMLRSAGADSTGDAVGALMAAAEGLVLHRLTVDPSAEVRPAIARAVAGCRTADA